MTLELPADNRLRKRVWDGLPVWSEGQGDSVIGLTRTQLAEELGLEPVQVGQVLKILNAQKLLVPLGGKRRGIMWARKDTELPPDGRGGRRKQSLRPQHRGPSTSVPTAPQAGKQFKSDKQLLIEKLWTGMLVRGNGR